MLEHQSFSTAATDGLRCPFQQDLRDNSEHVNRIEKILRLRRKRERLFDMNLFADAPWDMLLELYLSHLTARQISVSSLCFASGVPCTTALRWIQKLASDGLITKVADPRDGRRTFIELTTDGRVRMEQFATCADV